MRCRDFVDFLMDYLEDDLDRDVRRTFERHMGDCPDCEIYLETYRETIRLGKACLCDSPDDPVPEEAPDDLVQAILAARKG